LVLAAAPLVVAMPGYPLPMLKKVTPARQGTGKDVEILSWLMKISLLLKRKLDK
jgi:hypothetical protein